MINIQRNTIRKKVFTMLDLKFISHADSLNRLMVVLEEFKTKNNTPQKAAVNLSMGEKSVRHYVTFAKDLNYIQGGHSVEYKLTDKGNKLVDSNINERAEILFNDINKISEINNVRNNNYNTVIEDLEEKGITENSIERYLNTLKSLSNQTSSIKNIVNALNGELSHNGYNTTKKKTPIVKTWYCECGMVNAPAVQECDMCGEEKPELENAA